MLQREALQLEVVPDTKGKPTGAIFCSSLQGTDPFSLSRLAEVLPLTGERCTSVLHRESLGRLIRTLQELADTAESPLLCRARSVEVTTDGPPSPWSGWAGGQNTYPWQQHSILGFWMFGGNLLIHCWSRLGCIWPPVSLSHPSFMGPSPEVESTFVDMSPTVSWCQMDEATTNNTHLEIRDLPRMLAAMLRETLTHVSSRRLETNALPSSALTSKGKISDHAARVMCGELDEVQARTKKVKFSTFAARGDRVDRRPGSLRDVLAISRIVRA